MAGKTNEAVEVAKVVRGRENGDGIETLKNGVRVKFVPVSATLIDEVTNRVQEPKIPMFFDEEKNRSFPNESDPDYIAAVKDAERLRGVAAMDAMILFGLDLIDGVPEPNGWLPKLKQMERRGYLDLSGFDLSDPLDMEFLYKRYILADANLMLRVSEVSGISGTDVANAERSFQSNQGR